jgi:hypothetical protein
LTVCQGIYIVSSKKASNKRPKISLENLFDIMSKNTDLAEPVSAGTAQPKNLKKYAISKG